MKDIRLRIAAMKSELKKAGQKAAVSYERAAAMGATAEKRLQVMKKGHSWQYYVVTGKETRNRKYIPVTDRGLAKAIAQRDYDLMVMKSVKKWIRALEQAEKILGTIPDEAVAALHMPAFLSSGRRELIQPYALSDAEFAEQWGAQPYWGKARSDADKCFVTKRGERVRSKSEKIIADRLADAGIPYRYEAPLRLKRNLLVYPDFTILIPATRRQVYFEHLGMVDKADYADSAARKMNSFAEAGLIMGKDVFFTFETNAHPISEAALNGVVQAIRSTRYSGSVAHGNE